VKPIFLITGPITGLAPAHGDARWRHATHSWLSTHSTSINQYAVYRLPMRHRRRRVRGHSAGTQLQLQRAAPWHLLSSWPRFALDEMEGGRLSHSRVDQKKGSLRIDEFNRRS
jgi:hypothetical protein